MIEYRIQEAITRNSIRIVRNRCMCTVCKTIIESKSVHDWVQCACGRVFTDGGADYIRRGFVEPTDIEDLTEFEGKIPLTD